jgi:type IV secretion system protein VirB1
MDHLEATFSRDMDPATFIALTTLCAPLVDPDTAQAIVSTESAFNPHAIGVVAGSLERQPRDLEEAIATAQALRAQGRNFSVGLAQINVHNLDRLGLSLADGFDSCKNLQAMQVVLAECFERAGTPNESQESLRRALSCYYSGNFTTGFRHGYVSRVVSNARKTARAPP